MEITDMQGTTYADYDVKKVLIMQSQSFSQSVNKWIISKKGDFNTNKRIVINDFLDLYFNLTPDILAKLKENEIKIIHDSWKNYNKLTTSRARQLVLLIQKALYKYGITNMSSITGDEV